MGRVTVIEFVSLDGVMEDPDGSGLRPRRMGLPRRTEAVAGDKFSSAECSTPACCSSAARPGSCSPASGRPHR